MNKEENSENFLEDNEDLLSEQEEKELKEKLKYYGYI